MEEHRERVVIREPATAVDERHQVTYDVYAERRQMAEKMVQIVYLIFGIVIGVIFIRFLLLLFGANPDAPFATMIYGVTAPLVAPFVGLFGTPRVGPSVFDFNSVVGMVVYGLLAWVLARVIWLLVGETRSAVRTASDTVERRIE